MSLLIKAMDAYVFLEDWPKALQFIDICLSKDFKDAPQRPDCFYEKARIVDAQKRYSEALVMYNEFVEKYPGHRHAGIAKHRIEFLTHGY